jgi:cytochrome P450
MSHGQYGIMAHGVRSGVKKRVEMGAFRDVVGPSNRWFGLVHLWRIQHDFLRFAQDMWQTYGDVVSYHVAGQRVLHFALPEHAHAILVTKAKAFRKPDNHKRVFGRVLGEVLFTSDGDAWIKRRRMLGPLFHAHVLDSYRRIVMRQAHTIFARLSPRETNIAHARFAPACEHELPPHCYLPFGLGPRACIGRGFAMMEGPLVLTEFIRQYRIRLAEGQGEPELETQLSLHPKVGVRLQLFARASVEGQPLNVRRQTAT